MAPRVNKKMRWEIRTEQTKGTETTYRARWGDRVASIRIPADRRPTDADFDEAFAFAMTKFATKHGRG